MNKPTGTIFLPKKFSEETYVTDRYHNLFKEIQKRLGWDLIIEDDIDVNKVKTNYLLIFKCPQADDPSRLVNVKNINRTVRLIGYYADLQQKGRSDIYIKNMDDVLDRCDIILTAYKEAFIEKWEKYWYKTKWFPQFYGPDERFDKLDYNFNKCIKKILLIGATTVRYYPLRNFIDKINYHIKKVSHPGYQIKDFDRKTELGYKTRDLYAEEINKYCGTIATCSTEKYVIAKYFEIPAAGSLLIANKCNDLVELGFKEDVHYVEIDKTNVHKKILHIIQNFNAYWSIIKEGREFVQKNFSTKARVDQFVKIIEEDYENNIKGKGEIIIGNRLIYVCGANDIRAEGKIQGNTMIVYHNNEPYEVYNKGYDKRSDLLIYNFCRKGLGI